jgi:hypothetical protein
MGPGADRSKRISDPRTCWVFANRGSHLPFFTRVRISLRKSDSTLGSVEFTNWSSLTTCNASSPAFFAVSVFDSVEPMTKDLSNNLKKYLKIQFWVFFQPFFTFSSTFKFRFLFFNNTKTPIFK